MCRQSIQIWWIEPSTVWSLVPDAEVLEFLIDSLHYCGAPGNDCSQHHPCWGRHKLQIHGYPALAAFTHSQEDRGYILKTFWFANPRNKGWRAHSFAAAEIRGNVHMLKVHAA
jgi:hypothetical protein